MALDIENNNQAYLCGRLFAVLEKVQSDALPGYKIVTGEIIDKLIGKFPKTLPLSEQGKFIIGYYQQTQDFYKKKEDKEI